MKTSTLLKNWTCETAIITSACLILVSPLVGHTSNDEQLWTVSGSGDLPALKAMVKQNAALVSAHDRYGMLPLHYAAEAGQVAIMKFLLENGADITDQDNRGWTALHHAVDNKQIEIMELLIAHGAKVDAPNSMQWTPLHLAVLRQNKVMVISLIKAGANVYAKTSRALTPYNMAVDSGNRDLVDHLVAAMVNKDESKRPIMYANNEEIPGESFQKILSSVNNAGL